MDENEIKYFLEAALLAAGRPLSIGQLQNLFDGRMTPEISEIRKAIAMLNEEYENRGIVISEVASGFRMQVKSTMARRLEKLWEERPPRYSRALFETLALIAYRQPITRGEIEEIRGVSVSSNITRQLLERDWVRIVGQRDVPGRPSMFGTTKGFLDYFSLKRLDDLPPLADLSDWESLRLQLNLPEVEGQGDIGGLAGIDEVAIASDSEIIEAAIENDSEIAENAEGETDLPAPDPEGVDEQFMDTVSDDEELAASDWPQPVV
ncbi:MAG: SMC-Scp complex subunit ScpB [Gammaproteobacteria bacterium]|jgi:segregation and condensation protein B|nr:SMC-Scp complex subunit ScpB [Gammaproteobacteria bacterium]